MGSVRSRIGGSLWTSIGIVAFAMIAAGTGVGQTPADAAWARGDREAAERLYAARLAADSTDDLAMQRLALLAAWSRRFDESLALFDRLLTLTPTNVEARVAQGRVLAWKGELRASLESFDRALRDEPSNREALRAKAQVLAWDQRLNEAARLYDSLVRTDPADSVALFGSALVATWEWRLDSAEVLYDRILARAPRYLQARQGKARVTAARGDLIEAERQWRAVLAMDSTDAASRVGLSQALRWQGRNAAAYEVIAAAREAAPFDRDVQDEYEWVWSRIGARVAGAAVYEQDSDANRMFTVHASANWPLIPRVQVEARTYRRSVAVAGSTIDTPVAYGGTITARKYFGLGWSVSAGLGLSGSDAPGTEGIVIFTAALATPGRSPFSLGVGYDRFALDATGPQVRRGVRGQQVRADLRWRHSHQWVVSGGIGVGDYDGTESNLRVGWDAKAIRHFNPNYSAGLVTTFFAFQKDLNDGYFDPDFFKLVELEGSAQWQFRRPLNFRVWGGPGLQQVRSGSQLQATLRLQGRLTYQFLPGREARVDGSLSTSGVESFATDDTSYRYGSIGVSFAWVF